ncbi:hypothetical protein [Sedimentibacter sp. LTW-03]
MTEEEYNQKKSQLKK